MTDSPAAPDRTTTGETAAGALRNAIQVLAATRFDVALIFRDDSELSKDLGAVARLLRAALAKLDGASGPPNTQDETK